MSPDRHTQTCGGEVAIGLVNLGEAAVEGHVLRQFDPGKDVGEWDVKRKAFNKVREVLEVLAHFRRRLTEEPKKTRL